MQTRPFPPRKLVLAVLFAALAPSVLLADDAPPPPPPYALPWGLRPAAVTNVIRSDNVVAEYEDANGNDGTTVVYGLIWGAKINDKLGTVVRVAAVDNDPPTGDGAKAFVNPV